MPVACAFFVQVLVACCTARAIMSKCTHAHFFKEAQEHVCGEAALVRLVHHDHTAVRNTHGHGDVASVKGKRSEACFVHHDRFAVRSTRTYIYMVMLQVSKAIEVGHASSTMTTLQSETHTEHIYTHTSTHRQVHDDVTGVYES